MGAWTARPLAEDVVGRDVVELSSAVPSKCSSTSTDDVVEDARVLILSAIDGGRG